MATKGGCIDFMFLGPPLPGRWIRYWRRCHNSAMTLLILFSLKIMELLENGLRHRSGVTPLFSMRTVLLASSRSCHSVDADAWCKQALIVGVGCNIEVIAGAKTINLIYHCLL